MGVGGIQARGGPDRAVDVRGRSAYPAHHVVMVVTDTHLDTRGAARRLDPTHEPDHAEGAHCVIDGLLGDSPEPELDGRSQGVDIGMRVGGHLVEQRQAGRRNPQAGAAEKVHHSALASGARHGQQPGLRVGVGFVTWFHVQTISH